MNSTAITVYDKPLGDFYATREEWLHKAHALLWDVFLADRDDIKYPDHVRLACSWCKGGKAIGQAWYPKTSEDGASSILICPSQAEPLRVLDILLHEMLHHVCHSTWEHTGHGKEFKAMVQYVGLVGKPTATYVEEGSETEFKLKQMLAVVGAYPHSELKDIKGPKQENPYVCFVSINEEKYKVRLTKKAAEFGAPIDPWGDKMTEEEKG